MGSGSVRWTVREEASRTVFVGRDYGTMWPLAVLWIGGLAIGYPKLAASLTVVLGLTGAAALAALMRGFRLEVSSQGFTLWHTLCGIPYRRRHASLDAKVQAVGGFGEDPDRVVIEQRHLSEDMAFGSAKTCVALREAVAVAAARWTSVGPG